LYTRNQNAEITIYYSDSPLKILETGIKEKQDDKIENTLEKLLQLYTKHNNKKLYSNYYSALNISNDTSAKNKTVH